MTDAGLLADHLVWAATTPAAANQALNIVNGDVFRWRRHVAAARRRARRRAGRRSTASRRRSSSRWPTRGRSGRRSSRRHGLRDLDVETLASWWHTDADLGRTIETFTDMGRSRRLGFLGVRDTESSFTDLFARLRAERIVP